MIEFNNLSKSFGAFKAVDNLNLKVGGGALFGFLGPNGAGKSTTIKMLTGIYGITEGDITVCGISIKNDPVKAKMKFGYIPDQPYLYDKLTGIEFLWFCGGLYSIEKKVLRQKTEELIERLKLGDWIYKRTEEYSQGMKQRIAIASAFLHEPDVIILDEPMVGLDPQSAQIVKKLLRAESEGGRTVFMSTHSLNVVEEICTDVGIINRGRLIFNGTLTELLKDKNELQNDFESLFIEITREKE
ncbi:MAG: ABC transporter ATP-binding protein [Ignavibacteriaceae bacterium]|nr:ABC transporter ATP-binding protein [Ignavibacteriaceae bacterium]